MLKFNKKGFAFSELLMVTVVVVGIFMIIYTNIFPIMGELETRKEYNDLSANYVAFYLRKALINADLDNSLGVANYVILYPYAELPEEEELEESPEVVVDDGEEVLEEVIPEVEVENQTAQEILGPGKYSEFLYEANVESIVLTKGYIGNLKSAASDDLSALEDYIDYLPYYKNLEGVTKEQYRLIIKTNTGYATTLVLLSEENSGGVE